MMTDQDAMASITTSTTALYVGIDVGKTTLNIDSFPHTHPLVVNNDEAGHVAILEHLRLYTPALVVLEATGGMESAITAHLALNGIAVAVVNPKQARDFAKAIGVLAKTDVVDARVLARFGEAIRPPVRPLKTEECNLLGHLLVRRRQLIEMITAEGNRLHNMPKPIWTSPALLDKS